MKNPRAPLADLLPRGAMKEIAEKLGVSPSAVSKALRIGRPTNPAVAEAVRIVELSGVVAVRDAVAVLTG